MLPIKAAPSGVADTYVTMATLKAPVNSNNMVKSVDVLLSSPEDKASVRQQFL